jgi:hypothetical protein
VKVDQVDQIVIPLEWRKPQESMMQMVKIVIATIERAADGIR